MKNRFFSLLGVLALSAGSMVLQAQDYDDIYYDNSSSTKVEKKSEPKVVKKTTVYTQSPTKVTVTRNYKTDRDVDEYNRRGSEYDYDYSADTLYYDENEGTFGNTQRIERFYNPDIVVNSNDEELIELYYDDTPSVNLIIGSNYGYPRAYWGIGYGSYWYDPWYSWYDPFYYHPWYYSSYWYRPYYSWGWYNTWGWGWRGPYYGWTSHHHHYGGYHWGSGHHHGFGGTYGRYTGGRRPGDNRSLLDGRRNRPAVTGGSNRGMGLSRRPGNTIAGTRSATDRPGSMTGGRTRPSTSSGGVGAMSNSRSRGTVGNVGNRAATRQSTGSITGGSMRNSRTSSSVSSGGRGYSDRSFSGGSSSRSYSGGGYSGSSRSSSSSYGGSRGSSSYGGSRSSGSYSGGSSRGSSGGFSGGGGGSRGSSGGGGGRRH